MNRAFSFMNKNGIIFYGIIIPLILIIAYVYQAGMYFILK